MRTHFTKCFELAGISRSFPFPQLSCAGKNGGMWSIQEACGCSLTGARIVAYDEASSSRGSAWCPVMLAVFKTVEWQVNPVTGVFDSHTLPPIYFFA